MSKTIFLNIFLSTLVILLFKKIIKTRYIFISLALIFIFFTSLQLIRISKLNKNEDLGYDFFSLYVLSGMPAFDTVKENSSENYGENTFRFFYAVGNKLGISDLKAKDPILNYVYVNKNKTIVTNVYTTLYPFFKDFGYYGIFYSALVIGFFYGYVYKKVQKNNKPMTITFSILVVGLVTQFMNETTISTLSFIIQILILSHIPYWSKKFVLKDINPANKIQN
jgi:oligosaccharide repeat unit polymerase